MVKTQAQQRTEIVEALRGGKKSTQITHILEKEQMHGKGRLFALTVLKPGASIGYHKHEGDFEAYYFIKGEGLFNDNNRENLVVRKGDLALIAVGESHSIENTGTEDLEFIALILFD